MNFAGRGLDVCQLTAIALTIQAEVPSITCWLRELVATTSLQVGPFSCLLFGAPWGQLFGLCMFTARKTENPLALSSENEGTSVSACVYGLRPFRTGGPRLAHVRYR